jgi:hypothetical protein
VILGLLVNERRAMPEGGDDGPSFHAYRLVHVDAAGALSNPHHHQRHRRTNVLATLILRHDQSRNLEEITKILDESGFWAKFPPEGIIVESWYVAMGLGHVVTLRVPPGRLHEVNRSVEQNAWKVFHTEVYT